MELQFQLRGKPTANFFGAGIKVTKETTVGLILIPSKGFRIHEKINITSLWLSFVSTFASWVGCIPSFAGGAPLAWRWPVQPGRRGESGHCEGKVARDDIPVRSWARAIGCHWLETDRIGIELKQSHVQNWEILFRTLSWHSSLWLMQLYRRSCKSWTGMPPNRSSAAVWWCWRRDLHHKFQRHLWRVHCMSRFLCLLYVSRISGFRPHFWVQSFCCVITVST